LRPALAVVVQHGAVVADRPDVVGRGGPDAAPRVPLRARADPAPPLHAADLVGVRTAAARAARAGGTARAAAARTAAATRAAAARTAAATRTAAARAAATARTAAAGRAARSAAAHAPAPARPAASGRA